MTTASPTWAAETVQAAGARLELVKGGSGEPLLVLHDEMGQPGWLRFHEALARRRTVLMPSHPGFGGSPRLDWIISVRDLAGFYLADGVVRAAVGLDRGGDPELDLDGEMAACARLVSARARPAPAVLADEGTNLWSLTRR